MRVELGRLHSRLQATMIFVTHDQTEAMTMGDRIVCMNGGRIQQVGTPMELYAHPANEFVGVLSACPDEHLSAQWGTAPCSLKKAGLSIATSEALAAAFVPIPGFRSESARKTFLWARVPRNPFPR